MLSPQNDLVKSSNKSAQILNIHKYQILSENVKKSISLDRGLSMKFKSEFFGATKILDGVGKILDFALIVLQLNVLIDSCTCSFHWIVCFPFAPILA